MTLKEIKTKFSIYKRNGLFHLYTENHNWYSLLGYFGSIKKISDKSFQFRDNKPTTKFDKIINQITEFNSKQFRPSIYNCQLIRTGYNDFYLIQDELTKVGFKRQKESFNHGGDSNIWELKTKVFGSEFKLAIYILSENDTKFSVKEKEDSRYFKVGYSLDTEYYSPSYLADCYGAESVLYLVNRIKTFVLENTIKQMVELYEKELVYNKEEVKIENECVVALDSKFRLWIDVKTWDQLESGEKIKLQPIAYFKKQQDLMIAADLYSSPEIIEIKNSREGLLEY